MASILICEPEEAGLTASEAATGLGNEIGVHCSTSVVVWEPSTCFDGIGTVCDTSTDLL